MAYKWKSALKYSLMILLSISNNCINIFIQSYLILYIQSTPGLFSLESHAIYISLLLSTYDISRILLSYLWDILSRLIGIHIPVTISLFLLSLCNILINQRTTSSILHIIVFRLIIGVFNPLPLYTTISFCEMFSAKQQKRIGHIANIIKNLTGCLILFLSAFITFQSLHYVTFATGVINLLTAVLYIIQFKCHKRLNSLYQYQENEIEISKSNSNYSNANSMYVSNQKIIQQMVNGNGNNKNVSGNQKVNKSIDSSTNKNFKQLNSESVDNNLDNMHKLSGKESGKISTLINCSLDKGKFKFFNLPVTQMQMESKMNVEKEKKSQFNNKTVFNRISHGNANSNANANGNGNQHQNQNHPSININIINNNQSNQMNNNPSPPKGILPRRVLSTNQTNQTPKGYSPNLNTLKRIKTLEEKKDSYSSFYISLIHSLVQSNYYLLFFTFLIKLAMSSQHNTNTNTPDQPLIISQWHSCLLLSLYHFLFIIFTPLNNYILSYLLTINHMKKRIKIYHLLSVISLLMTIVYYIVNIFLQWSISVYFIYIQLACLVLRNELLMLLTSCLNISVLHMKDSQLQEQYSKHQKKSSVLITFLLILILLFLYYFFISNPIIVILSYYLTPFALLLIAYILGINILFDY